MEARLSPSGFEREILIDAPVEVVWAVVTEREHISGGDNSTLVEFSLRAEGDSTRLTVVESGFRDLAGRDDEKQGHFHSHRRGWELELGELDEYLRQRTHTPADR